MCQPKEKDPIVDDNFDSDNVSQPNEKIAVVDVEVRELSSIFTCRIDQTYLGRSWNL